MFWLFRFSSDKDKEFDEKQEGKETKELFTAMVKYVKKWTATWFIYKWDNILSHIGASLFFLWIGEANIAEWLGEIADKIPKGANEAGTSASIGFFGSFIAEGLKKLINLIKT